MLFQHIQEHYEKLITLAAAGLGGSFFRVVFFPQSGSKRWLVQFIAGIIIAICLGGAVASAINKIIPIGYEAYLTSGFILGVAGEAIVKRIQKKYIDMEK